LNIDASDKKANIIKELIKNKWKREIKWWLNKKKNVQKKVMIKQNWKSQREEALDKQNM